MQFEPDNHDARLTAYALGELDADEAAAVERQLADDPAATAQVRRRPRHRQFARTRPRR